MYSKIILGLLICSIAGAAYQPGGLTDTQLRASPVPVTAGQTGTWNVNNISGTVSLPTGAATEATLLSADSKLTTLGSIDGKIATLGQKAMAGSTPVVIASDQTTVPYKVPYVTASGTIVAINGAVTVSSLPSISDVLIQVTGTYTGALTVQATIDGTNWITLPTIVNVSSNAITATIASAAQGIFRVNAGGATQVRVIALAAVTGTATVTINASATNSVTAIQAALPTGTNSIGTVILGAGTAAVGTVGLGTQAAKTAKQAAVTVGTTAVRATTDGSAVTAGRVYLGFRLDAASAANCFYGSSTVTSSGTTRGIPVFPGELIERNFDAGDYYLICDTAGQTFFIVEQE